MKHTILKALSLAVVVAALPALAQVAAQDVPRWTTYDAKIFGVTLPTGAPTSIQDRTYTSPIWY